MGGWARRRGYSQFTGRTRITEAQRLANDPPNGLPTGYRAWVTDTAKAWRVDESLTVDGLPKVWVQEQEVSGGGTSPPSGFALAPARVRSRANVGVAAPGANIDGIAMAPGDRVLLIAQAAPIENGVYVWAGAAVPMVRAADLPAAVEAAGASIMVEEGEAAGVLFLQTAVPSVVGTNALSFDPIAPASSAVGTYFLAGVALGPAGANLHAGLSTVDSVPLRKRGFVVGAAVFFQGAPVAVGPARFRVRIDAATLSSDQFVIPVGGNLGGMDIPLGKLPVAKDSRVGLFVTPDDGVATTISDAVGTVLVALFDD